MGASDSKISKGQLQDIMDKTHFSKQEIDGITSDYMTYSKLGDGKTGFSKSEFIKFFELRFGKWEKESVDLLFKAIDSDGNGTVDLKEFINIIFVIRKANDEEKLSFIFDLYDTDKNGYLNEDEVKLLLNNTLTLIKRDIDFYDLPPLVKTIFNIVSDPAKGLSKQDFINETSKLGIKFIKVFSFYDKYATQSA